MQLIKPYTYKAEGGKGVLFLIFFWLLTSILTLTIGEVTARRLKLSKTINSYRSTGNSRLTSEKFTSLMGQKYLENINMESLNIYHPDLTPNKTITLNGVKMHIDKYGFRNNFEYDPSPLHNVKRIIMIGDSVTFGYLSPEEKIFSTLLRQELNKKRKAEVLNFGIGGNNTYGNFYILKKAISEFSPDLIVYQFGLNDITKTQSKSNFSNKNTVRKINIANTIKVFFQKSALYLFFAERYNYIKLKLGWDHWSLHEWNFSEDEIKKELNNFNDIYNFLNKKHTPMLFVFFPYGFQVYSNNPLATTYQNIFKNFWEANQWPYLDLTPVFKRQKNLYNLFLDDAHLSIKGHAVTAEYLLPHLETLLEKTKISHK